ncbi:MAG TPA: hypothetical protein PLA43_04000 [Bryobacteraceae bacterium]|nr:hypothetical protein [Bryobacteraceae bacterium]HOQ47033.1 hypothetical protein [Bryobacteraceae bacterium]HPQ16120.1 hypothetical protein [Bryobacteraceae bacterium]HPU71094.1 hypothetical protein [Bryobacteraceae bacterium]
MKRIVIAVFGFLLIIGAAGCRSQGQATLPSPPPGPIYTWPAEDRTAPAGTLVVIRTLQPVEAPGGRRIFSVIVARDIPNANGKVIVRGGSPASISALANPAGGYRLGLHSVLVGGNTYLAVPAGGPTQAGRAERGAPLGTLVDIVRVGDSEPEQPAAGASVEGSRIHVPASTLLFFRLQQPLSFE